MASGVQESRAACQESGKAASRGGEPLFAPPQKLIVGFRNQSSINRKFSLAASYSMK